MQVINFLNRKGIIFKRRGEELIYCCPFCEDREFKGSINSITGAFNCLHLNKCGAKGSFYDFQKRLGDTPEKLNKNKDFYKTGKKTFTIPNQDIPPMTEQQFGVYKYLKSRGFTDETIKYFRIGAQESVVKFPFFKNGKLVNIKYRDIQDKKRMWQEKDAEPVLFNRDNITENVLVICEGEYDCMALHQYGIEAVSVPNGASGFTWIDQEWEFLDTFPIINICFDSDDAGQEGAAQLASKIGLWRCRIVKLPHKDANDCLKKGTTLEQIIACFNNAIELTPETIVSPNFFNAKIQKLFAMGSKLFGMPTPWTELNQVLKGWRMGELTVWSGRNGAGKSTILNQVILDIAKQGDKSCIYSGEMSPERYLRWAIIQLKENDAPSPYVINEALDWMTDKMYILNISDSINQDKLLEDFEYAARRFDCKHFIVDSLMKININEDDYVEQKRFVSRLVDFCKKFNVHVHLVAHPRKTGSDQDEPGKVDIKGSSHITDLAFNVIILNRSSDEQKEAATKRKKTVSDTQMYVKKNREFGNEGRIHLWFNEKTKKFSSIQ